MSAEKSDQTVHVEGLNPPIKFTTRNRNIGNGDKNPESVVEETQSENAQEGGKPKKRLSDSHKQHISEGLKRIGHKPPGRKPSPAPTSEQASTATEETNSKTEEKSEVTETIPEVEIPNPEPAVIERNNDLTVNQLIEQLREKAKKLRHQGDLAAQQYYEEANYFEQEADRLVQLQQRLSQS